MTRLRLPGLTLPFVICSLILVIPTLLYITFTTPPPPRDDATTSIRLSKAYQVGDEVSGEVIMPKLANETAK